MKIFGILATGTYFSPWTPFTLASIYAIVDGIIVVNAGFDLDDPKLSESSVPVPEVTETIEHLDVQNKIIEITDTSILKRKRPLMSQKLANTLKLDQWYDPRGRNMTLASEVAYSMGAKKVLRIDSDQVVFRDALNLRGRRDNLMLFQYEFVGSLKHIADPGPTSPYND